MIYIDEHIYGFDLEQALKTISAQRREQALKYRHELGRRTCVLAYLLLKRALSQEYGITDNPLFEYGKHGKPAIVGHPDICFNLSHCRQAVACAVSSQPIGIDVESIRNYHQSLVDYTMNATEAAQICCAEQPAVAFTRLWTMKEARLKLTGEGIANRLKDVLNDRGYNYHTVECLQQGYIYTVCQREATSQSAGGTSES